MDVEGGRGKKKTSFAITILLPLAVVYTCTTIPTVIF